MSRLRYIGSKARIADKILTLVGQSNEGRFFDVFSGTGVVSREAAKRGWRIRANDHLISSSIITFAQLVSRLDVPFAPFGGYECTVQKLNNSPLHKGFIFSEYTPSGKSQSGHLRQYFSTENGMIIDGMRNQIDSWCRAGLLQPAEFKLLIADLLEAVNRVANIAGTYGCYLRYWTTASLNKLAIRPRELLPHQVPFEVSSADAFSLSAEEGDLVYLDPPYTKRQYAAYYHVLETIAAGDAPIVEGVTGLRPWSDKSSPFCFKRHALNALSKLCNHLAARRVFISYSSEGHIELSALKSRLGETGRIDIHELGSIGRYRPNEVARGKHASVVEFLIEWEKYPKPLASCLKQHILTVA
jgi:adenine-specific DNA-methyltransferase